MTNVITEAQKIVDAVNRGLRLIRDMEDDRMRICVDDPKEEKLATTIGIMVTDLVSYIDEKQCQPGLHGRFVLDPTERAVKVLPQDLDCDEDSLFYRADGMDGTQERYIRSYIPLLNGAWLIELGIPTGDRDRD